MSIHHVSEAIFAHRKLEDYFFSSISLMNQHIGASIRAYITGVETHALNFLLVSDNHERTIGELNAGIQLLNDNNVPFLVSAIAPDNQVLTVLQQAGFEPDPDSVTTVMQLDLLNWQVMNTGFTKHEIRCVDHDLSDWVIPLESAFGTGSNIAKQYLQRHQAALNAGKCLQHYVLYADAQPVSALTISTLENNVRLDDIATVVEKQGNGYASVLINCVLNATKQQGARACYLESSRVGNGVYRRIGFKPLFECQGFIREENDS
ncbi:MAG: GNAT family N-acetyltransferase [Enterobacteriaceae bacterium]|jgi:GNAT superfamily N-acetyltransferase|nr:GNAT family N-acetyltransferase [Enterobacteriaceae bacterium]